MEKIISPAPNTAVEQFTCNNCKNLFYGAICNSCGEKVFQLSQLSSKNFFSNILREVGTPYDNKLLKSIVLSFTKPGFLTGANLKGIRVPYAKPVQLFIVVNLLFYLLVVFFGRTDYIPAMNDNHSSYISDRPLLGWTAPIDNFLATQLNVLREEKLGEYEREIISGTGREFIPFTGDLSKSFNREQAVLLSFQAYNQKVSFLSKTLIFLLIPVIGVVLFLTFRRRLKYYGAALILATHFLVFNMLLYIVFMVLNFLPEKLSLENTYTRIPNKIVKILFYNDWFAPVSELVFALYQGFEAIHIICWTAWLFLAFKRLFNLHWVKNLLTSYLLSRVFFLLIFSLYKKFLIACALWVV